MALGIEKSTRYGVSATYWRIIGSNIDWDDSTVTVHIGGYLSLESRQAEALPIQTIDVIVGEGYSENGFPLHAGVEEDTLANLYAEVKLNGFFEGAQDI